MCQKNESFNSDKTIKIDVKGFENLLASIREEGYRLIGPAVRDGAVVYDDIEGIDDLPRGFEDEQSPGEYRLRKGKGNAFFDYVVGPYSWKKFLFPPVERIGVYDRDLNLLPLPSQSDVKPLAFLGVRACEVRAIAIQDRVFLEGPYVEAGYRSRREGLFLIGVNCSNPASTCFCTSMGTGPNHLEGYDLCLTEVSTRKDSFFLVEIGSERGQRIVQEIASQPATEEEIHQAKQVIDRSVERMGRTLETEGLPQLLDRNFDHPRWEQTGERCLACGNCTMVCPTCFCSTVQEVTDLAGDRAERWRRWDSCFTGEFSYIHGGNVRQSIKSRYRQWMTHKLSNWVDQFGTSGCVGCGRCLTWCPVGIDITEEAKFFRDHDLARNSKPQKGED